MKDRWRQTDGHKAMKKDRESEGRQSQILKKTEGWTEEEKVGGGHTQTA